MKRINQLFAKFRSLILYGIIGVFSSSLDFGVYTLLVRFIGIPYLLANCISVVAGIGTSFTLNRAYNFKVKDKTAKRFVIFLCVGLTGLACSNLILYCCIQYFHLNELISKLLSIVLVVIIQFVINKTVTFKSDTDKKRQDHLIQAYQQQDPIIMEPKIFFVMPAYNEADNIEDVVKQWHPIVKKCQEMGGGTAHLVIANDGSKDNTYEIMSRLTAEYPLLVPIDKPNSGHGSTVLTLYRYALDHGATHVFQTDSDGQTDPQEFWQMFDNRDRYDFQIGYRYGRQDGFSRVVVTKTLRLIVWLMFQEWVKDANTPFRLMKADKLRAIMEVIPADYFLCNVAISAIAKKWGYKIGWYHITFKPRQGGVNSINLRRIVKIGWKALGDFRAINKGLRKK